MPDNPPVAEAPNSLDAQESPVARHAQALPTDPQPAENADIAFRHSGWAAERARVREAIAATSDSDGRLERYDACGANAWVMRNTEDPSRLCVMSEMCRDRFCAPCAGARSATIATNLLDLLGGARHRFVTLTLRHSHDPLRTQLDRLTRHYRRLRHRRWWRERVTAAAAFLELKRSKDGQHWHPHLHILTRSKWLAQGELSNEWHQVTGDSYIVDVRPTRNDRAAKYVAKYATKALKSEHVNTPALLQEAIEAMHRRRAITLTGEWAHANLTATPGPEGWEPCGRLSDIIERARAGNESALTILRQLDRTDQCTIELERGPPEPQWQLS